MSCKAISSPMVCQWSLGSISDYYLAKMETASKFAENDNIGKEGKNNSLTPSMRVLRPPSPLRDALPSRILRALVILLESIQASFSQSSSLPLYSSEWFFAFRYRNIDILSNSGFKFDILLLLNYLNPTYPINLRMLSLCEVIYKYTSMYVSLSTS